MSELATTDQRYVPAAGRRALTALYDPAMRLTMREGTWRPKLLRRLTSGSPESVLDVGCGTGTLAIDLARAGLRTIGIDGDPDVLRRAAEKAREAGVELDLRKGLADAIPLVDVSVDRVVCSLVLHHLPLATKTRTLAECRRVLRPGGRLVVADWGRATDPLARAGFLGLQLLDGFETTRDHAAGRIPGLIADAGFSVSEFDRIRTAWGTLELLEAHR